MNLTNEVKKVLIKGFYTVSKTEYTKETALKESNAYLQKCLKYINNISEIEFIEFETIIEEIKNNIEIYFIFKSVDITKNHLTFKYKVREIACELEQLLGVQLSINLE